MVDGRLHKVYPKACCVLKSHLLLIHSIDNKTKLKNNLVNGDLDVITVFQSLSSNIAISDKSVLSLILCNKL